ncbi:MAG: hypothetical protein J3K34DRAFT_439953 [Monoraphidium minutum]|nr:MAG: hypothetical protein J3K34DRAFT_439953 [Monoraphidium minutum]
MAQAGARVPPRGAPWAAPAGRPRFRAPWCGSSGRLVWRREIYGSVGGRGVRGHHPAGSPVFVGVGGRGPAPAAARAVGRARLRTAASEHGRSAGNRPAAAPAGRGGQSGQRCGWQCNAFLRCGAAHHRARPFAGRGRGRMCAPRARARTRAHKAHTHTTRRGMARPR